MNTTLIYKPNSEFLLSNFKLNWGVQRETIRTIFENNHSASDLVVDSSASGNPDNIIYKRDVYEDFPRLGDFFFLLYDSKNSLSEIEIHKGVEIVIENIKLTFDSPFPEAILNLKSISNNYKQLSEGEYLFKDLKISVADSKSMGGDENTLSYFYCADSIDHLT